MFQEVKKYIFGPYQIIRLQDLVDQFHYSGSYKTDAGTER